jgi:hypothetical protein
VDPEAMMDTVNRMFVGYKAGLALPAVWTLREVADAPQYCCAHSG